MTSSRSRGVARVVRPFAGLLAALLLLSGCKSSSHEETAAKATAVPYDREKSIASFEQVWQTVNDKHWDPDHAGVDWDAVHAEFRPRIESATSLEQARGVMEQMLARLGQSHFGIWPQEVYERGAAPTPSASAEPAQASEAVASEAPRGPGTSGMDLRVVDGAAIVTSVRPRSPADTVGVRPGYQVLRINDRPLDSMIKKAQERKSSTSIDTALGMMVNQLLTGDAGDRVDLLVLDESNKKVNKRLTLGPLEGTPVTMGNMPTLYLTIDSRMLPANVAYFGFNIFMNPPALMAEFQKAVESAQNADGFIIDLRGNPGGLGALAMGIGNWFVEDDNVKLGTMSTRSGTMNFILNPRLHGYGGPLAILIDGMSGSTSEILAGGMKDIGRARIFGQRSAGAALPSVFDTLPNGDRFQYAVANYTSVGGRPLEGEGVTPDEVVVPSRTNLLAGRDPVVEAAVRWIKSERAKRGTPATNSGAAGTP